MKSTSLMTSPVYSASVIESDQLILSSASDSIIEEGIGFPESATEWDTKRTVGRWLWMRRNCERKQVESDTQNRKKERERRRERERRKERQREEYGELDAERKQLFLICYASISNSWFSAKHSVQVMLCLSCYPQSRIKL